MDDFPKHREKDIACGYTNRRTTSQRSYNSKKINQVEKGLIDMREVYDTFSQK